MKNLPHLELTENPNKNNDFIIFRHSYKGKQTKSSFTKKYSSKKNTKKSKTRKGFFNIF
jgi:hypothetical protein